MSPFYRTSDMISLTGKVIIMELDELLTEADALGLPVTEKPFRTFDGRIKNNKIYLRQDMSHANKKCVLAEELGHHYTTVGNILDQSDAGNRKQEYQARIWAYDRLVGLTGIIDCYKAGCQTISEMAEYLEVTEQFLREALERYRQKYGIYTCVDNFIIYFEPYLAVVEML